MKLNIAIMVNRRIELKNWELRLIEYVFDSENFSNIYIISEKKYIKESLFKKINLSNLIFKLQEIIEKILFREISFKNKEQLIKKINNSKIIYLTANKKKYSDSFDTQQIDKIKYLNLDIILRLDFRILKGEILNQAKYGIWSFHHGDNSFYRGGPAGFWEIYYNKSQTGVTLQILNNDLDSGNIIERGFYNTQWSYVKNYRYISEYSIELFKKNIRLLRNNNFISSKYDATNNILLKKPKFFQILFYIYKFYSKLFRKVFIKFIQNISFNLIIFNKWKILVNQGSYNNLNIKNFKILNPPKNEFWADPFIIFKNNKKFIFFENYSYKEKKGKISFLTLDNNNNILQKNDILNKNYHLSFPSIFIHNNDYYMAPESCANKQQDIYKCINFPNQWTKFKTIFVGESVVDTIFFRDDNDDIWLFCNKSSNAMFDHNSELYIYKVDKNFQFTKIESHKKNPVLIDSKFARNGGNIIKHNNSYIRVSQSSVDGIYGKNLNFHKIINLSLYDYEEILIKDIQPNFVSNISASHHYNSDGNNYVMDACFKFDFFKL